MVIEAARDALAGASLDSVVGRLKAIIPKAQMLQTADTLKYLYKGGRMGKVKVAFVHAAAAEEAEKLKAMVEQRIDCVETLIAELSPALGVHTGPGAWGYVISP